MNKYSKSSKKEKIENSILQVKDSMNRLQAAIDNKNTFSTKNIYLNNTQNVINDSMSINSKFSGYNPGKNITLNNYLDNSKKLNYKAKITNKPNKIVLNNSNIIEPKHNINDFKNFSFTDDNINNNYKMFNNSIEYNMNNNYYKLLNNSLDNDTINHQNQKKYIKNLYKHNTNNTNRLTYTQNKIKSSQYYKSNNYLINMIKSKKLNNPPRNTYNTNTNIVSYQNPLNIALSQAKPVTNTIVYKNKNAKNLEDLYKYGEYLTQELKMSNDTNTQLLENYINLTSHIKSKNEENKKINNKIKKLTEEDKKLNKANEELKQNFASVQKIIENNNLSHKTNLIEAQKHIDSNQNKINELIEINKNLKNTQINYENEIIELEKIINDLNNESIDEQYKSNINIKNKNYGKEIDEEKEVKDKLDEFKLRNSIIQKEIEQLENENENINEDIIIEENDNNINNLNYNDNDNDKYQYKQELMDKNIKEYEKKSEYYINEIKQMENEIDLKNNDIDNIKNEINNLNKYIIELENKKRKKEEYYTIKNNNYKSINKLNQLNDEIKTLLLNKEQLIKDYDNEIKQLDEFYNDKKQEIFNENIDNETKKLMEENKKLKDENNDIIQALNDLPDLKDEYDKLIQTNSKLKEELEKIMQK